jgi:predicted O-methyltransferase YrrM
MEYLIRSSARTASALESFLGRPIRHLTPRYMADRLRLAIHERRHPDVPWLAFQAVAFLESLLRREDRGLEYGSGRSTRWFAARTRTLTSVEHAPEWRRRVSRSLRLAGCRNVRLLLVPADERKADDPNKAAYVTARGQTRRARYDYIIVDGLYRDICALSAARVLRSGGLLILDNAEWYLPADTHSPGSVRKPASDVWSRFSCMVSSWRHVWYSNGVFDTAIWIKP